MTSNAQSTAWAVQGLVAAGRNPRKFRRTRTPLEYLKSLQAADGSVRYSRTSTQTPVWVTAQALAALEGKAFPLKPAPRHRAHATAARRRRRTTAGAGNAYGAGEAGHRGQAEDQRPPTAKKTSAPAPKLAVSDNRDPGDARRLDHDRSSGHHRDRQVRRQALALASVLHGRPRDRRCSSACASPGVAADRSAFVVQSAAMGSPTGGGLTVLTPREASIFACLVDTVAAPEPLLPPVAQTDAAFFFDRWMAASPRLNALGMRALLHALELVPLAAGLRRPAAAAAAWPSASASSTRSSATRTRTCASSTKLMKGAAFLAYYGDDDVMRRIGYDADANVERGRALRAAEGRP